MTATTITAFTKTYPRAKVARHKVLDGWTIELLLRASAKPIKVNATYATLDHARGAALAKLGVKPGAKPAPKPATPKQQEWKQGPDKSPTPAKVADTTTTGPAPRGSAKRKPGTCVPCGRPMRPAGTKATDYPGTVLRQRDGLCQSCNYQKKEPK